MLTIQSRFGNNYANLGSISGSPAGKYRVRYANAVGEEPASRSAERNPSGLNAMSTRGSSMRQPHTALLTLVYS